MTGIKDKVIVITGAGSGIGRSAARLLAERGAKIVVGARRAEKLESLVQEIEAGGGVASFKVTDTARREDVAALVAYACELHGKLDVLISNAGVAPISKLEDMRVEDWETMVDINFKGVLYGVAAALPIFLRQGFGHFVNTISTSGLQVSPTMAVYAATKNAVRTLGEGLRIESEGRYRVTGISPGFVATDFVQSMTNPQVAAAIQERMDAIALEPEAIARAMIYAIEQPDHVDVGDLVIRPAVQN
ncbi:MULTISPECIES: SDR family oxidoreductase [unclassified Sphingomonas]|uniref:SDR family oxidoreductase n=1 Tax=unclassified Sphingomonas TaxID=196159 RepID=UPI0006F352D0|nr:MULTISPECIES: SDR family oxidoreductase [unclassified Sphingomonas]KQX25645.1 oxidoreductase [Sphingomonas sp. Root1294]KQY66636.1 oxidoreductase [Sphingomonas sp. Root50]KRB90040.1 oxidoreductase [Sphingomonas sp. Root720]